MIRGILAILVVVGSLSLVPSARAQTLSPEGDFAFWCYATIHLVLNTGGFGDAAADDQARRSQPLLQQGIRDEASRLGWTEQQAVALMTQYGEEVATQFRAFSESRDISVFRLNPGECIRAADNGLSPAPEGATPAPAVDLAQHSFSSELDIRVWCQEVLAYMAETGTAELAVGPRTDEQTRHILDWTQGKIEEEVAATGMRPEVLAAFRAKQRDDIVDKFARFLETRNPDDLSVIPGFCYTIDFDPGELFEDLQSTDPVEVAVEGWSLNLWCRAAMRHMTREKLFENYGDRQRGQKVFITANNQLKVAAEARGLSAEQLDAELREAEARIADEYQRYWPDEQVSLTYGMGPCLSIGYGDGTEPDVEPYEVTKIDLWCYGALIQDRISDRLDDAGQARAARALKVTQDRIMGDHVFKDGTPFQVGDLLDRYREAVSMQFNDPTADMASLLGLTESCYRRAVTPEERVHSADFQQRYWCVIALRTAARSDVIPDAAGKERAEKTSDAIADWLSVEFDEAGYGIVERVEFQNTLSQAAQPLLQQFKSTRDESALPYRLADCYAFAQ